MESCVFAVGCIVYLSVLRFNAHDGDITFMVKKEYISSYKGKLYSGYSSLIDLPNYFYNNLTYSKNIGSEIRENNTNSSYIRRKNLRLGNNIMTVLMYNAPSWVDIEEMSLSACEYNNCYYTDDRQFLKNATAVSFCPSYAGFGLKPPPKSPGQVWISYSLEAPVYYWHNEFKSPAWDSMINWTMTYTLDSDILRPYGSTRVRKVPLKKDYDEIWNRKRYIAVMISSHCRTLSRREEFVDQLRKYGVQVIVLGKCGQNIDQYSSNETALTSYINEFKFFLAFENSFCKDYITEKFFQQYPHDLIVVARGGGDYDRLLKGVPVIDTKSFTHVSKLADYIQELGSNKTKYIKFLKEKDKFEVISSSYQPFCDLCRKLNHKDEYVHVLKSIGEFALGQCYFPVDL